MNVGRSTLRVDAYDKVIGRTKYTDDLCDSRAYVARVVHATIAHGRVRSIRKERALEIPGVVAVFTGFDLQEKHYYPTAGHPWSTDPGHQDVADRLVLETEVKFHGDDVAVVVAENEVAAQQGAAALEIDYEEYPFVLDVLEAIKPGAPQLHAAYPNNILGQSKISRGNLQEAIQEEGLIQVEGWYTTPVVQHCHIENFICYAEMQGDRIQVVSSTQIPHICRRVVGQALGVDWGKIRVIKPYIGGGFGNKQDVLYEPLCAWLTLQLGGHPVKIELSREETMSMTRTRHGLRFHLTSWLRPDGHFVARKMESYSDQGGYASHGHSICAKGCGAFPQLYPCDNVEVQGYTVFTNKSVAGAMRGYGIPQLIWAIESHTDDICKKLGMDPIAFRRQNLMQQGYVDAFSQNELYDDSFNQCMDKAMAETDFEAKRAAYSQQTGNIRRGIGLSVFWYNTGVYPISLESSSCRMVLNQDGSLQVQLGETEIGQGADTVFTQMTADVLGVPMESVHVMSVQDTDLTPFGTGAYASRQTYAGGFAIRQTAQLLREKILAYANELTRMPVYQLDLVDGQIVRKSDGRVLMSLGDLATTALYSLDHSVHFSAETTAHIKTNAYSFGCTVAEVEVDLELCKVKLLDLVNVHDAGRLINPALAEAQVHGGMSMGIGFGLSEQLLFNPKTGAPYNNNLLDYKLSTTLDHPSLRAFFVQNPEPTSAFGTKSLGEPPTCSVAPAIRNAVLQATGVSINEAPLTPHKLYRRFVEEGVLPSIDTIRETKKEG